MKVIFYCFSGTGNTLRTCQELAGELKKIGHEAQIVPIVAGSAPPDPGGFDAVVIGYPVHAFNAPAPVLKFLKQLPKGNGKPCFLVRTSGEPLSLNQASGILPKRILRRRGFCVRGEFHYVMPYNIIFRHSDGMAARMNRTMESRSINEALQIAKGTGRIYRNGPIKRLVSFLLRIEHPAMKRIGRHFRVTADCMGCKACETNCPQGNIRMENGKPKFGKSCVGCMACSFGCPEDAVRLGILNGWRVNGRYKFDVASATDAEVCHYCRKSYLKYFHSYESRGGN